METELNKPDSALSKDGWKKAFSVAVRILVSVLILSLIVSLVQWQNVLVALQSADSRFMLLAVFLLIGNLSVRTLKWHTMLRSVKESPTFAEAYGSVMLGISLGSFTPGELGDIAGRALHITDAKRSHLVGLTLLDKLQIFVVTSCAGGVSLACLAFDDPYLRTFLSIVIILLSCIFMMRLGFIATLGQRLNTWLLKRPWLSRVLDGFQLLTPSQLLSTALYTLLFHGVLILQMYCLLNAFSPISFLHAFVGTSAMMFVKSLLPISIGDLGVREAGSIYFFSLYGISQAAALNASLILFFINIFVPSLMGTYFIRHQQLSSFEFMQFWKK
jgi:uncharacterized protein (TIRG00374 family)